MFRDDKMVRHLSVLSHPARLTSVTRNCTSFLNPRPLIAARPQSIMWESRKPCMANRTAATVAAMDSLLVHLDQGCKNQVTINPHRWSGTVCFETCIA